MTAPARRRWVVVASVLLLLVVAAVTYLVSRDEDYLASPDAVTRPDPEPAEAVRVLRALEDAVAARDTESAVALAGDSAGGADLLRAVVANAEALDVADFTLRYVDETSSTSADGAWTAAVDMTWRFSGFDREPVREEVLVGFDATGPGASVTGIGGGDRRTPLWLAAPLEVRRGAETLVLVDGSAADADRYAERAVAAVPAVRAVLPDWPGGLVVEVPDSAQTLDAMLAADPGTYTDIAAVSATVDGTLTPTSPAHVFVNPDLYRDLGPAGEQVVMTHEATHIATDAPVTSGMPLWLLEGFADYVALRGTDLPISKTAGQVIAQVRAEGVPEALPGPAEFDATAGHLGAAYEAAWLACQLVADLAGEEGLVRLYDEVSGGADIGAALRSGVGLDESELTRRWQDRLQSLAATTAVAG
ncbi:hypothetical protein [Nocardioides sp.]|uniref:hypothetical protein n=1 Tax=Nocardioides sp. TaxID=35761 RepID=UPI001A27E24A|nr:hypothetical protein [Nocardioides sp.]MBJ7359849.1 hypothetical protein [Nocardioides sp.]